MIKEPIVFVGTSDLTGLFRGKSVPAKRLDDDAFRGVGWVPTNALITCFESIAESPYGSLGDLLIVPDQSSRVNIDFDDGSTAEQFVIGNVQHLDGEPFTCCTRAKLADALRRLDSVSGLTLVSSFEHEFQFSADTQPAVQTPSFSMKGHRDAAAFGETLVAALRMAGLLPESFINEYGADQYEIPVGVAAGLSAADQAVILREIVHATALRFGARASFNPIRSLDGVGNGVHVHFSLQNADKQPVMYDAAAPHGLSLVGGSFVAGILKYLPEFLCLTAPIATSYSRLTPHRWSAAFNNLGAQDREASLRICPVSGLSNTMRAQQFNIEYRAADAAASPYLVLAAIAHAGAQGLEEQLPVPEATAEDLSLLDKGALEARGFARLPTSLSDALKLFETSGFVQSCFGEEFQGVYCALKRAELACLEGLSPEDQCVAYGRIY